MIGIVKRFTVNRFTAAKSERSRIRVSFGEDEGPSAQGCYHQRRGAASQGVAGYRLECLGRAQTGKPGTDRTGSACRARSWIPGSPRRLILAEREIASDRGCR